MTEFRCFTDGNKMSFYNIDKLSNVVLQKVSHGKKKFQVIIYVNEYSDCFEYLTREEAVKAISSFFGIMHD